MCSGLGMGRGVWAGHGHTTGRGTTAGAYHAPTLATGIFVYILSVLLLRESFTVDKTAAIILCVIGMCIVAFTTEIHGKIRSEPWGYGLALLSAFIFALYEVLFKLMDTDSRVQVRPASAGGWGGVLPRRALWIVGLCACHLHRKTPQALC